MGATLSPEDARELAALRRRAYALDADLDHRSLARLQALEAAAHPLAETDFAQKPDAAEPPAAAPPPAAAQQRDVEEPVLLRRVRTVPHRVWWIVGAALVALVIAGWTIPRLNAPQSDLTLERIPAGEEGQAFARSSFLDDNDFDVRDLDRFEAYAQLQVWVATATTGDRCLLIDADDYGIVGVSCTPADLDPIVDVRIWRGMRHDVFGDLPVNTVLRFVHTDERVHLWVRSPASEE